MKEQTKIDRRNFIKGSAIMTAGLAGLPLSGYPQELPGFQGENMYLIGPRKGYSTHVGTLLSMMTMMRAWVVDIVGDLTVEQLDFQIDEQSNSIGAMLLHLAATERYYQLNTFDEMKWGAWSNEIKEEWNVAMSLGPEAREQVLGNTIDFYLEKLESVRAVTIKEFAKKDDAWIMKSEKFFGNQQTNNYCKWFHVCEHESNHLGQIKFVMKRMPR